MFERLVISEPHYFTESTSECGYCSGKKDQEEDYYSLDSWYQDSAKRAQGTKSLVENCTFGFQGHLMSVEMYDKLCNMGFRRSGQFIYKSDLLRNCCRLYTIRTTPEQVIMSKEFKSTLRRFSKRVLPSNEVPSRSNYIDEILDTEFRSKSFRTHFEPPVFSDEKYRLFAKYQEHVHNDFKHSAKSFRRFLCASPFAKETVLGTKEEWEQLNNWKSFSKHDKLKRRGPVHECYYHEDKMIALAVSDILPSGLSSVYFIWDPDYHKWSLGKLSALRELTFVSKANLDYYYMGYYLDDCPKMNYKAKYGGELLDVCTHKYVPLTQLAKLKGPGKLFAISETPGDHDKILQNEFPLNDELANGAISIGKTIKVQNVAEEIYGINGGAYAEANAAAQRLADLGIPYKVDELPFCPKDEFQAAENGVFQIPNVVPGLVPLNQIHDLVQSRAMCILQGNVDFFDMYSGDMRPLDSFEDESPTIKKLLCDVVRAIGLENSRGMLVII